MIPFIQYVLGEFKSGQNKFMKIKIRRVLASKTTNYLGIDLIKELKDLYTKNYKRLIKETDEDTNKWKVSCLFMNRKK